MSNIKSEEDIKGIKEACKLASDALIHIEKFILPGCTTEKLNYEAHKFITSKKGKPAPLGYHGYPKSICTSLNEVVCHGIPSAKEKIKNGDLLKIDVSVSYKGYYGDLCKSYAVGDVSDKVISILNATKQCMMDGISVSQPGNKIGDIGLAVTETAEKFGYGVVHMFTGHGIGKSLHEEPTVHHDNLRYSNVKIVPGMTFTIEPMINEGSSDSYITEDRWTAITADGGLSAQFEHTILITENGPEILTYYS